MPRLHLLGGLELIEEVDGRDVPVPLQPKRAAVLAHLALAHPRPWHRRDTLLSMFWPESGDKRARSALSKAIHYLRRSAGADAVLSQGDEELRTGPDRLWCDAVAFEEALEQGRLEDAVGLYRGDLMVGFHLSGAVDFGQWLDAERSRLRGLAARAAWALADAAEQERRRTEAARWGRQAVAWSPTDEVGLRRLLELLHGSGNRAEAIRTFESYRKRWDEEYGIEPSEQTTALVDAIREGSLETSGEDVPALETRVRDAVEPAPVAAPPPGVSPVGPPPPPVTRPLVPTPTPPGARVPAIRSRLLWVVGLIGIAGFVLVQQQTDPAGARQAPDLLAPGGRVVLADFADFTDQRLGPVVTEALRVDLANAPALALLDRADVSATLERMQRPRREALVFEVARDVAERAGAEAVLEGTVSAAGAGYILTAALRSTVTGHTLASFRVVADGPHEVIPSIEALSRNIRARGGTPLETLEKPQSLQQVTTSSLQALRLYTDAVRSFDESDDRTRSAHLLEEALVEDPGFAMAWRLLAVVHQGGRNPTRRNEAIRQAFEHRDRLQPIERHHVEAMFYGLEQDPARKAQAYRDVLRIDPDEPRALNNLAFLYMLANDFERAEPLLRRVVARGGPSSGAYLNLVSMHLAQGRGDEAMATLSAWERDYPGVEVIEARRFAVAFVQGDLDAAARHAARSVDDWTDPGAIGRGLVQQGRLAQWAGRLDEGRQAFADALTHATRQGPAEAWSTTLEMSYQEALLGDRAWAAAQVRDGLRDATWASLEPRARRYGLAALTLMLADDVDGLNQVIEEWRRDLPDTDRPERDAPVVDAVALSSRLMSGSEEGAVESFDAFMRAADCAADPCRIVFKAWFYDLAGQTHRAVALFERIRSGGYLGWGTNTGERVWAMTRLGPLYESLGDSAKAREAYERVTVQWAEADARGMATVKHMEERLAAASPPAVGPPETTPRPR
ncbi:MAG: BTAD domain-containing putative transcriptional regulator [Longimicrobiales bacterium]